MYDCGIDNYGGVVFDYYVSLLFVLDKVLCKLRILSFWRWGLILL